MADTTVTVTTVDASTAIPAAFPALNRLAQPLTATPADTGITTAAPVNDGHASAEKRTTA